MIITKETIETRLRFSLARSTGIPESRITQEKPFYKLDVDILDICQLVLDAELFFNIVLPHDHMYLETRIVTFGDMCNYVMEHKG